jgi:hypothetical protein
VNRVRFATRVFAVSFGIACAVPGSAESLLERDVRREQSARDAGWTFGHAHDGVCLVVASGRSRSGAPAVLGAGWSANDGFNLDVTTLPFSQLDAPSIAVVGTTRSYAFPKTRLSKMTGQDVVELKQDIAAGHALRVSGRTEKGAEDFDFPVGSGAMAIAALDACAEMFEAHPVPRTAEFGNGHMDMVSAQNLESGCSLTGRWSEAGGFWLAIDVARNGAAIQLRRRATNPDIGTSGTLDLRDLGGGVMKFAEEGEIPFSLEQIAPLERALLAGETRSIRVTLPGKAAEVLEFGGPRARAATAMFAVCRAMFVGGDSRPMTGIALVSDIHGNLPALEAVARRRASSVLP